MCEHGQVARFNYNFDFEAQLTSHFVPNGWLFRCPTPYNHLIVRYRDASELTLKFDLGDQGASAYVKANAGIVQCLFM